MLEECGKVCIIGLDQIHAVQAHAGGRRKVRLNRTGILRLVFECVDFNMARKTR